MSLTDPIANAITKIRNAYRAKHKTVTVNFSNVVEDIVKILAEENFINSYELLEKNPEKNIKHTTIFINLRYTNDGLPVMRGIERVSKPGLRVYVRADNMPSVFNNTGCAVISTSKGVMVDREARSNYVGGEYLCKVW